MGAVFATVWTWARIPVAVVLLMLVAALIYYLFPNTNFMRYKACVALRIPHI